MRTIQTVGIKASITETNLTPHPQFFASFKTKKLSVLSRICKNHTWNNKTKTNPVIQEAIIIEDLQDLRAHRKSVW